MHILTVCNFMLQRIANIAEVAGELLCPTGVRRHDELSTCSAFLCLACVVARIPPVCIFPYNVYSKINTASTQIWEAVKVKDASDFFCVTV